MSGPIIHISEIIVRKMSRSVGMTTSPGPDSLPGTTASQASQLHPVFLSPLQLNTDTRVSGLRCQKPHYICLFSLPIVVIPVNMFGDLKSAAGVKALDEFLAEHSYIEG